MNEPRPIARPILTQEWVDVSFVHWRVKAERVAPLLPKGVVPDEYDGSSWVGLVPFRLRRTRLFGRLPLPWGTFNETNLRLYVRDAFGDRGVVFLSLDAEHLAAVLAARLAFSLPYEWARMRTGNREGVNSYVSRRWRSPRGVPQSVIRVRPRSGAVQDEALANFLTARWALYSRRGSRVIRLPNSHEPWPLQPAELVHLRTDLLDAHGLSDLAAQAPDSVLYSPGVHARFGRPAPLTPAVTAQVD